MAKSCHEVKTASHLVLQTQHQFRHDIALHLITAACNRAGAQNYREKAITPSSAPTGATLLPTVRASG